MKTAMQFLKKEIENKLIPPSKENGELSEYQYSHNVAYGTVLTIIEYLLEKEKEQIIDARIDGDENYSLVGGKRYEYAEQYYNETYNQNKS